MASNYRPERRELYAYCENLPRRSLPGPWCLPAWPWSGLAALTATGQRA